MTIAFWCVLIAALLPYVGTIVAKTSGERYNNRDPRAWLDRQTGVSRRADNAQKNGFEAFPLFAAAVIIAHVLQAPPERVDILAIIFIIARIGYLICYLANWQAVRSLVWLVGFVACLTIFLLGV
jgi:uncharacterized MAPEG superfamily protein